ncbi:Mysoin-binding motif of peroxisomes-domain-containing protein [Scheffersomyces coipomensis]|uniref:Mysoin-binding motif of peroxisomes-domain-containing protein n=1 Tax=Scheffersomyces coipomensis TaxID=1788519 RepID=UPI00315CDF82
MNFDRLNPLSRYLSFSGVAGKNINNNDKSDELNNHNNQRQPSVVLSNDFETFVNPMEVSDWGIEESVSSPTLSNQQLYPIPTNHNIHQYHQPQQLPHLYPVNSRNSSVNKYHQHNQVNHDFYQGYPYYDRVEPPISHVIIKGNTENFSKFIHKYLSMEHSVHKFWEKFKYNLVISDFLDNSMILSKNEQSLINLEHAIKDTEESNETLRNVKFYDDFNQSKLTILNKSYRIDHSGSYSLNSVLLVISLIIKLLNQLKQQPVHPTQSQYKLFKYLILISSKLIKFYKFKWSIQSNQILSSLNTFLLLNYKINKRLIQNLIILKELEMFKFLKPGQIHHPENIEDDDSAYKQQLKSHVIDSLSFLNLNLKSSIKQLLPYLNGELLESYFNINNIIIPDDNEADSDEEEPRSINYIVNQINKFNQLRRLLICQLLTLNESSIKKNFFIYKLEDQFDRNGKSDEITHINNLDKLTILQNVLENHNSCINNMHANFTNFDLIYNSSSQSTSQEDQNILNLSTTTTLDSGLISNDSDSNLNQLISKLSNLTTNLKYFQKYNQSIKEINNIDELNEKILIFNQFNDDLTKIKQLYQSNQNDLNNEVFEFERQRQQQNTPSVSTNSHRSSLDQPNDNINTGEFSLKSFHTSTSSGHTKIRSSSRTGISTTNSRSPSLTIPSPKELQPPSSISSGKKYKRLSTGLQLGLLTVFEDSQQNKHSLTTSLNNRRSNGGRVSLDMDNYATNINYESYNQEAFNKLSSNSQTNNQTSHPQAHYSLNSVNSNISGITDLINSSHITSYNEELIEDNSNPNPDTNVNGEVQGKYSKSQLKLKLEESFNRIYNLENENKKLKGEDITLYANNTITNNTTTNEITTTLTNNTIVVNNNNPSSTPSFLTELDHVLSHKLSQPHLQG